MSKSSVKFKVGDLVRRGPIAGASQLPRLFRLTLVTDRVFSAKSADGLWMGWGGPISTLYALAVPASTGGEQ